MNALYLKVSYFKLTRILTYPIGGDICLSLEMVRPILENDESKGETFAILGQ
ncbi:hypothetical protein [Dyadobacter sp. OTU695]|uniref:hypothetical protein n=1 Tax=Dyadobacter sp. OTU695 TaxID=3043860 RepID=UPI00313D2514